MIYVFVIPRYFSVGSYYAPSLGMGYVMAALKQEGRSVLSVNLNEDSRSVEECLKKFNPKNCIVLTGGLSVFYNQINDIISTANRMGFKTVLGGGIITADPIFVYNFMKPTYGVVGEADQTIIELATALEAENMVIEKYLVSRTPGIVYQKNGDPEYTGPRKRIKHLEDIPFPEYDMIGIPKLLGGMNILHEPYFQQTNKPRMVPIVCSRGCPYKCSFCFSPIGKQYHQRSLEDISAEIKHLKDKYDVNMIMFLDEIFAINKERVIDFCDMVHEHDIKWICQLRVDSVDMECLNRMRWAGCVCVSWGIESVNDDVLKGMHKKTTRAQIEKALAMCYEAKIGIQGNFIFGTLAETDYTWRETLAWWCKHDKYMINLSPAYGYPGSEMYNVALKNGRINSKELYLKEKCPRVNVADMSDFNYENMITMTTMAQMAHSIEYLVSDVKIAPGGKDALGRELVDIYYTCPHCGQDTMLAGLLKGYDTGRETLRYACALCNQRSDFNRSF